MRLWLVLTLTVNCLVLMAFLAYGSYTANEGSTRLERFIRRDADNIATSIAASTANSLLTGSYDELEDRLLRQVAIGSVEELVISDALGRVVGHARRGAQGKAEAVYERLDPIELTHKEMLTDRRYVRLVPIERSALLGWVRITSSLDEVAQARRQIWVQTLTAAVVTLLLVGTVMTLILRRAGRKLEGVSQFAGNLVHQHGTTLIGRSRIIEIRQLETAMNEASRALAAQFHAQQESEARKGAMQESSLDALVTIDLHGIIVDFNPAAETTFGYRRHEVLGRLMGEVIVPPVHREAHHQGMRRYLATGEGPVLRKRIEITAMRRSGDEFPVELSIVPFRVGKQEYFIGSLRDISERKALEAEQKRVTDALHQTVQELEYQKFALDQHSIVSIADPAGKIVYANDKFAEISGYDQSELIGANHRIVKSGMHPDRFYQEMWECISSGKVWHGEIANRSKLGEIYWVSSTIVPWLDAAGLPYQYVSIRTDITRQQRVEHELAQARARELATGIEIQRSLLTGQVPSGIHGAYIASYSEPSQGVDGDFFAITRFRSDCFELLVGDVMGKGVPAALIGAAIKSTYNQVIAERFSLHAGTHELPTPADIINALHRSLTPRLIELNSFATLALYRFDGPNGILRFVNAGHTPGLLARGNGAEDLEVIAGDNLPIGVIAEEVYKQYTLALHPGDALLVYSDGITETFDSRKEEFGLQRLSDLLRTGRAASLPPTSILQAIRQQVRSHGGTDILADDQTAVMVEMRALRHLPRGSIGDRVHPAVLLLPWRLGGLDVLRGKIAATFPFLAPEDLESLVLASFEATTNILRHARPYFEDATIVCRFTQRAAAVAVELLYPGDGFTPPADAAPDFSGNTEGGFGLYLIEQCVDEVEYSSPLPGISRIRLVKQWRSLAGGTRS